MTAPCPVASRARSHPLQPAVVFGDTSLSYLELNALIDDAVQVLNGLGVGPGDRVGIRLGSKRDFPVVLWALFRLRAVAVLLSDRDPVRRVAKDCLSTGCSLLVSDVKIDVPADTLSPEALRKDASPVEGIGPSDLDLDTPATIVFTSGSQSRPKAVVHSLRNHWYSAQGSQSAIPVSTATRWGVVLPLHHVGGLSILFRCFRYGGTVVLSERDRRDPTGLAALGVTHVSIVPTQLIDWLPHPDRALLCGLDTILVGGAATAARIRREALDANLPVRFTYGSTEMASQIATTDPLDKEVGGGYAGRLLPHRKVRIRDGEILVAGETRFLGYWSDGGLKEPFDKEGWFATGDIGRLEGNRLFVTGRRDNRFISGGENICPEEVEEVIVSSGLADFAIVVPVENDRFGARPVAYVRPLCSYADLKVRLARILPPFKIPDRVKPLPETMNGSKEDRRKLMAAAAIGGDT